MKLVIAHKRDITYCILCTVQACVPEGLIVVRVIMTFGFTFPVPVVPY